MSMTFDDHDSVQSPALLCMQKYRKAPCGEYACLDLLLELSTEGSDTHHALLRSERYTRSLERRISRLQDFLESNGLEDPEKDLMNLPDKQHPASGMESDIELPSTPVPNDDDGIAVDQQTSDEDEEMTSKKPSVLYSTNLKSDKRRASSATPVKIAKKPKAFHVAVEVGEDRLEATSAQATPSTESISPTEPVILKVRRVRKANFHCSTLPQAVVNKLMEQIETWDRRRPQWEDGDRLNDIKCVYTFTCRNKTQWRQENGKADTEHACTACQKSRRLCVAWLSPGMIQPLPRRLYPDADGDELGPLDPGYWIKS